MQGCDRHRRVGGAPSFAAAEAAIAGAGVGVAPVKGPAGESSKCFRMLEHVCDELIAARIERGDIVVALGAAWLAISAVCRLAGAPRHRLRSSADVAARPGRLVRRRQDRDQLPPRQEFIGAFYQPILVVADTALLDTLPEREFRAGYAEVVKYGLLGDMNFFEWLDVNWRDLFAGGPSREHTRSL